MRMITADWLAVDEDAGEAHVAWHDLSWTREPSDLEDTIVEIDDDEVEIAIDDPEVSEGPPPIPSWLDTP